jgi:WD40 repeat protein
MASLAGNMSMTALNQVVGALANSPLGHPTSTAPATKKQANPEDAIQIVGNIKPSWTCDVDQNIYSLDFSPQGEYLAVGCGSGHVLIFHAQTGERLWTLDRPTAELKVAPTTIKWRPHVLPEAPNDPGLKNVIAVGFPDGSVVHWHAPTGQKIAELSEGENQIFSLDYSPLLFPPEGTGKSASLRLATAGSDCEVRIYQDGGPGVQCKLLKIMNHGARDASAAGHSNRIFCVRWHPTNAKTLISGGWDSTIQIWDVEVGAAIRSIFRPHVCGETLDWDDAGRVLAGARAKEEVLSLFNSDTGKQLESVPWSMLEEKRVCPIYSCRFSPSKRFFICGGGGGSTSALTTISGSSSTTAGSNSATTTGNELKIFNYATRRCVAQITGIPGACFTCSIAKDDRRVAYGGAYNTLHVVTFDPSCPEEIMY